MESIPLSESLTDSEFHIHPKPYQPNLSRILFFFLCANLTTFVFTVLPVLVTFPYFSSLYDYYGVNDIIRLLEPIIILPLTLLIIVESGFVHRYESRESIIIVTLFGIFSGIYQQGAGFHSTSIMFKNLVRNYYDGLENPDAKLLEIINVIRNLWEHLISHYWYAIGGILISFLNAYVYREFSVAKFNKSHISMWLGNVLLYGLTVGAVAVQFVGGSVVALVLTVGYGGILGYWLWARMKGSMFWRIRYPVIQYYFWAYVIGLLITVGWMAKNGLKNREEAGK